MKLFEDLPSTNRPITAENLNQIQDNLVVVSPTEPTGDNREKVWIQKGKNLIHNFYTNSHYNYEQNIFVPSTDFGRTDYIKVKVNVDYIFSHSLGTGSGWINCFDENFNYIEMLNHNNILNSFKITNTNVKYIMISVYHATNMADESWMQLEQDSTATEHEEYIEPKIYVKNDNGEYEEFISKEDTLIKYSTEEQLIGKWHNNNNVYRKTLLIDAANFNGEQEYFINYSDYGMYGNIVVNNYKGLCGRIDDRWQVLPCTLEGWHIDIYDFSETQFTIKVSQNQKNVGLTILTLVLEYEYKNW